MRDQVFDRGHKIGVGDQSRIHARAARGVASARVGLPATEWVLEIGAAFLRTEAELILKSRRVVPGAAAARDLVARWRRYNEEPWRKGAVIAFTKFG